MSVALLVDYVDAPGKGKLIPLATQAGFREDWLPACEILGLRWVPLFETGTPVNMADLPDVIAEIERLKDWFLSKGDEGSMSWVNRLEAGLEELRLRTSDASVKIYIG